MVSSKMKGPPTKAKNLPCPFLLPQNSQGFLLEVNQTGEGKVDIQKVGTRFLNLQR